MARKYRSDYKGLTQQVDYLQKTKNSTKTKGAVLGLAERNTGKVKMFAFSENTTSNITNTIRENVIKKETTLYTDESNLYNNIGYEYKRESVKHSAKEWVKTTYYGEKVHTNTVENFWSVMKRGVYGIYHQISYKHLQRYCDEFSYRYNSRHIKDHERFTLTLSQVNTVLPYNKLVYDGKSKEEIKQIKAEKANR